MSINYGSTAIEEPFSLLPKFYSIDDEDVAVNVETEVDHSKRVIKRSTAFGGLLLVLGCVFVILTFNFTGLNSFSGSIFHQDSAESTDSGQEDMQETASIKFTMARDGYDALPYFSSDMTFYSVLSGFDGIIEPYTENNIVVLDEQVDQNSYYSYSICPTDTSVDGWDCTYGSYFSNGSSAPVKLSCKPHDSYTISIKKYDISTETLMATDDGKVLCLYVRRELRSLSPEDLVKALDAMHTLWTIEEDEGQEIYGPTYHSVAYLAHYHYFNSAWQDSDHIDEGIGFISQHMKLSMLFEIAIQSVEPSISLPYW